MGALGVCSPPGTLQPQPPFSLAGAPASAPASATAASPELPASSGVPIHSPSLQVWPGTQTTVEQRSGSHTPARQISVAAQVTRVQGSTQDPSLHTRPAGQEMRPHASVTHSPPVQTWKSGQTTLAQRSTHEPATQASLAAQLVVSQPGSTHRPEVGDASRASQARSVAHRGTLSSVQLHEGPHSVVAAGSRATHT